MRSNRIGPIRGCGLARYGDGLQRINDEQRVY